MLTDLRASLPIWCTSQEPFRTNFRVADNLEVNDAQRVYRYREMRRTLRPYASLSSSVRYLGAIAFTLSMNAARSFSLSFGGGVVRVATRTPTSTKNFSCPAGEQIQSMRTASLEAL